MLPYDLGGRPQAAAAQVQRPADRRESKGSRTRRSGWRVVRRENMSPTARPFRHPAGMDKRQRADSKRGEDILVGWRRSALIDGRAARSKIPRYRIGSSFKIYGICLTNAVLDMPLRSRWSQTVHLPVSPPLPRPTYKLLAASVEKESFVREGQERPRGCAPYLRTYLGYARSLSSYHLGARCFFWQRATNDPGFHPTSSPHPSDDGTRSRGRLETALVPQSCATAQEVTE